MRNSGDNGTGRPANSAYNLPPGYNDDNQVVVSALFSGTGSASTAIREVRDMGVPAGNISMISRDEDLSTTEAEITGGDLPIVTDWEVPPNEPLGGSDRLGLPREDDMVRRNEAETNPAEDIHTDFPDQPDGSSPDSPAESPRTGA